MATLIYDTKVRLDNNQREILIKIIENEAETLVNLVRTGFNAVIKQYEKFKKVA